MGLCLITGGNSGIGKAAAIALAQAGFQVIIACRNRERGESALKDIKRESGKEGVSLLVMDMAESASIRAAAAEFLTSQQSLDVLIHNAADFDISRNERLLTSEGLESVWATNHIGPVLLTQLLLPALHKSPQGRIITIASQGLLMHPFLKVDFEDPEFKRRPYSVEKAYYQSKLAQVMWTYQLAQELRGSRVSVNCIRVSNVRIDISRYPNLPQAMKRLYALKSRFSISPQEMAACYLRLAKDPEFASLSGGYFDEKARQVSSSAFSRKPEAIAALMRLTNSYLSGKKGEADGR